LLSSRCSPRSALTICCCWNSLVVVPAQVLCPDRLVGAGGCSIRDRVAGGTAMLVKLHANAATTPKIRAYIQASRRPAAALARELGVSETTVRRWKKRRDVADRASTPHTLATGFSGEEEEIAVELRTRLGLSLDDVLEVMRRCLRAD